MNKVNFTSVLLGKNQHMAPTTLPNTKPINTSMGPLKMLNTMFPVKREGEIQQQLCYIQKQKQVPVWKIMITKASNTHTQAILETSDKSDGMPLGPLIISKTSSNNETYFLHPQHNILPLHPSLKHNTTAIQFSSLFHTI